MTRRIRRPPLAHQSRIRRPARQQLSLLALRLPLAVLLAINIVVYRLISLSVSQPWPPPIQNRPDSLIVAPLLITDHDITDNAFVNILQGLEAPFDFFEQALPHIGARPLKSDVVELRHCNLARVDYLNYTAWASPILVDAWPNFDKKLKAQSPEVMDLTKSSWTEFMVPEFALGLLEIYATHNEHCDFTNYPLQIAYDLSQAEMVLRKVTAHPSLPRFAIVIVAFKDAEHLERLIKAVHMPHHFVIIHLERVTPPKYANQVRKIISQYHNIALVQFGTVTYRTDSVSMINYQIMNWLVNDLKLDYDYHLTMGGAVYPLYSSNELALYLKNSKRDVWLGELLSNGKVLVGDESGQWDYLVRKRLIFTAGEHRKYQQRTKKTKQNGFVATIPDFIKTNMTKKTNSGNQAVFSHKFVRQLTNSPQVKELFAIGKYGCCCCLEERTWITAARIIGYKEQALEAASMFQVWGGESTCGTSMGNAVLSLNASICYKNEDATEGSIVHQQSHQAGDPVYVHGNEVLTTLKEAKKRGFMFARKFKSEDSNSMELLDLIQRELHQT